jgi:hypothetical protein
MGSKDDIPFQQNLGIIQPLLENLSITYESWIKYVNSSGAYIYTPINKQQCNFCRLIRSHPVGYQRCRETAQKCVYLNRKNSSPHNRSEPGRGKILDHLFKTPYLRFRQIRMRIQNNLSFPHLLNDTRHYSLLTF